MPKTKSTKLHRSILSTDYQALEPRQLMAVTFNAGTGALNILGTGGADDATVTLVNSNTVRATLNGSSQDFTASSVQSILFVGYDGNDRFENQTSISSSAYGLDGADVLIGGSGNDTLSGGNDNDIITGSDGNDILSGNSGADILAGSDGNDYLYGGSGNDTLSGGGGLDFVTGSSGDDDIDGGADRDTLSGNGGSDTINGDGGNDNIYGGDQDDYLFGDDGDDNVFGLNHNDRLFGGAGNDRLSGQDGDDIIEGETGDDILSGNDGYDTIRGGDDNDTIYGGYHDDELYGDAGSDTISGFFGNDVIDGGAGNDLLAGNDGNDVINGNLGNDNVFGGSGTDSLWGDAGNDNLFGHDGNDLLYGGLGNDRLEGGNQNDRLYGEDGLDSLYGGTGNDGLFGGIGSGDQLQGDAGSDRFMIWSGDTMVDRNELEAQIEFKNETSSWNESEIQIVDDGLHWLMEKAQTSLVVRDSLDTDPVVYSKWSDLGGAVGVNVLTTYFNSSTGYSYDREIRFLEWNENINFYNEQVVLTTIHEVGHSWHSVEEIENVLSPGVGQLWINFLAISQWTETNPNSFQFETSLDGEWWYHQDANFAYNYGRTNPFEDWATIWEAAYESEQGTDYSSVSTKIDIFDQLMAAFANA